MCQINAHDIALTLPNNLTGYIPITSISEKVNERIEKLVEEEAKSDGGTDAQEDDVNLNSMFSIGQYLRAYVVSTSDSGSDSAKSVEKSKRRIELSIIPQQANSGITIQELVTHSLLMASVLSVEDHGLIMDIGMNEVGLRGFMSSKEIGYGIDASKVAEGSVFLSMITGLSPNGKTVKLCADVQRIAGSKKQVFLVDAPTIDAFLPGTAIELLVTDITAKGLSGKVMGSLDVTADLMHSGAGASGKDLDKKYKLGSKIRARIVCTFPKSEPRKLGVSLLDHIMSLSSLRAQQGSLKEDPLEVLPISTVLDAITVKKVEPGIGLFVDVGVRGVPGFVHISRVQDGKIETLSESSGPFKTDSIHKGRIIGYNSMDGIYLVSLEQKVLDQAYLRVEDLKIGEIVKGKVEKLIVNAGGVGGVLINLAEGITGLAAEMHLADVSLLHPEKKFKEGMSVTARVLSTDPSKRQIRLTLKKSLVNSDAIPWTTYEAVHPGMRSPGTIVNILSSGAVTQFYGNVRGFLPVSEMSEAYIVDPSQHFRIGQVVNVHALNVDTEAQKLTVSCKDPAAFGLTQQIALSKLKLGEVVSVTVTEKSVNDVSVELIGTGLRANLPVGHLTDGSENKNASALKKIRVGQTLQDLVVLNKNEQKHAITLTNKPSLVQAAKSRTLLRSFDDVKEQKIVSGFVKNITSTSVFVQFAGGLTGMIPKSRLSDEALQMPEFGLRRMQSIVAKVVSVDHGQQRFLLSMREDDSPIRSSITIDEPPNLNTGITAINPVDDNIKSANDLIIGKLTTARVASIKETQINVQLADNIQGRIDISQVFDNWEEIKDRKYPFKNISTKQVLKVRVIGIHDARNHRFLPISHRVGKTLVFELSAKKSDLETMKPALTLDKVHKGSSWIGYVNNVGDDCLWVNISPNVRGRIRSLDISEDVSLLNDLESNFPIGSAIRVNVTGVDVKTNRLDLAAISFQTKDALSFKTLSEGAVVAGKVTRVNERHIMVQLSDTVSGPVNLTDLTDDFSEANPMNYSKNDIVRVCVVEVDLPNKRIRLSTRPSRVLNSSLPVRDPEIRSISQLKVNDIVRGFVKHIADNGVFVNLGGNVSAYIRISDLSDSFIKDWKSHFQIDQLVKGKVILADKQLNHIQLSLKASIIDKDYVAPVTFNDLKVGQIVTGKIRKVEDFGVFIVIDQSSNVSGLCHRSEIAEKRVEDVRKLYEEGDSVKAVVLKLEPDTKRISFGLKASYFQDSEVETDDSDDDDSMVGHGLYGAELDLLEDNDEAAFEDDDAFSMDIDNETLHHAEEAEDDVMSGSSDDGDSGGLQAGDFDWTASNLDQDDKQSDANSDAGEAEASKKKKSKRAAIKVDRTGDLDAAGPQSVSDFERLLLGLPNSSELWIQYMAFHMQLSELSKAREVAERAIRTINMREETEKLNVYIALLNLENAFGSDETLQDAFQRACQYNDPLEVHERLTSIYIQSGKHSVSYMQFYLTLD